MNWLNRKLYPFKLLTFLLFSFSKIPTHNSLSHRKQQRPPNSYTPIFQPLAHLSF